MVVQPMGCTTNIKKSKLFIISIKSNEKNESKLPELLRLLRLINDLSLVELSEKYNYQKHILVISNLDREIFRKMFYINIVNILKYLLKHYGFLKNI